MHCKGTGSKVIKSVDYSLIFVLFFVQCTKHFTCIYMYNIALNSYQTDVSGVLLLLQQLLQK